MVYFLHEEKNYNLLKYHHLTEVDRLDWAFQILYE